MLYTTALLRRNKMSATWAHTLKCKPSPSRPAPSKVALHCCLEHFLGQMCWLQLQLPPLLCGPSAKRPLLCSPSAR